MELDNDINADNCKDTDMEFDTDRNADNDTDAYMELDILLYLG